MKKSGKNAWLVTWEDLGFKHWGLRKPGRIVAVLPPQFGRATVKTIVRGLWLALESLPLAGRIDSGFSIFRKSCISPKLMESWVDESFKLGGTPLLYARKVSNLRWKAECGMHTATWVEPAVYQPTQEPPPNNWEIALPEREGSYSEREDEALAAR